MTEFEMHNFFRFLKEINAYHPFIRNIKRRCLLSGVSPIILIRSLGSFAPTDDAFVWRNTPEGQYFWSYINNYYSLMREKILGTKLSYSEYLKGFDATYLKNQIGRNL